MKRLFYVFLIVISVVLFVHFLIEPVTVAVVKKKVREVFAQSRVSVKGCEVNLLKGLTFSDIEITRGAVYDFKVRKLKISYSIPDIVKGKISKVSLEGADIKVNMGNKGIQEFLAYCSLPSGGGTFFIEAIELSGLTLALASANFTIDARASLGFSLATRALDFIDLEISQGKSSGISLNDLTLKVNQDRQLRDFYIREIGYDKIKVKEVRSKVSYDGQTLSFDSLSANVLSGKVDAVLHVILGEVITYILDAKVLNVDLRSLAEDLKLTKDFQMTGKCGGRLVVKGKWPGINSIDGEFSVTRPGGTLIIKDKKMIENIARSSSMPYEILVEGFRNYRYNNGQATVGLEGDDIILSAVFEGGAGKRSFEVRWHNFLMKKK